MCNFECNNLYNYNIHLTSKKHNKLITIDERKKLSFHNDVNYNSTDKSFNNIENFKNEVITTHMTQPSSVLEYNKSFLTEKMKILIESQNKLSEEQNKMNQIITEIINKPSADNSIINATNIIK